MQNQQIDYSHNIILYLDESRAFNRHLLSLIKQWDKRCNIEIHSVKFDKMQCAKSVEMKATKTIMPQSGHIATVKKQKQFYNDALQVIDENGSSFQGAEAVPIILKHLPFGKLAAVIYILPGTMWVTKQIYSLPFTH